MRQHADRIRICQMRRWHFCPPFTPSTLWGVHPFDRYAAFTDVRALKEASARPLRKSLRVNTLKTSVESFKKWAVQKGWVIEPVPWCAEGFFIDRPLTSSRGQTREALGKDLLHLLGHTYMQEAASMLPVELLDPQPGEVILDMSAAPGSKTTQMAAKMQPPSPGPFLHMGKGSPRGVIIANDIQEKRLWTLKSALHRSGVINAIVTKKVGQWFGKHMTERFDRVLCDAPCTAQGTSRKDSDALVYSSLENVGKMAKLQKELLEAAVHACKVGGRIVYSTCTLTPEENEEVVRAIIERFKGQVEVVDPRNELPAISNQLSIFFERTIHDSGKVQEYLRINADSWKLAADGLPFLRLWPQTFDTEGFFCAVLRKTAPTRQPEKFPSARFQEEELPRARKDDVGVALEKRYGNSLLFPHDRLFARNEQLLLTTHDVASFRMPVTDYSLGLPFALRLEDGRVRVSHEAATYRGHLATDNVAELPDAELDLLLDGKDAHCDHALTGDVILHYHDLAVGVGLAKDGHLKNRLPRWLVVKS